MIDIMNLVGIKDRFAADSSMRLPQSMPDSQMKETHVNNDYRQSQE